MGKPTGFLEIKRKEPVYRPRDERLKDFSAVELSLAEADMREQAARCMECGTPFCHACGCPLHNVIPELNDLVYHGRWAEAYDLLRATNNFPEFTGRICPAPCEAACVIGLHDEPMAIRQIELAIIETAFARGLVQAQHPKPRLKARVAVIGSGPAGLAVADTLNYAGYSVTVFDSDAKPGGILRYGIPDFKLEKWVIDRRIELMRAEGVTFEMGAAVGEDISARYLLGRFDAICLALGAREPRDLAVPGRELKGIHFALDYLIQQNLRVAGGPLPVAAAVTPWPPEESRPCSAIALRDGESAALPGVPSTGLPGEVIHAGGKTVVIIGGGDTGSDCLGTALRQGAKHVYQFEILPKPPDIRDARTPWPMWPNVLRSSSSHQEGGERRWSVLTKSFTGVEGHVCALQGVEVVFDKSEPGEPLRWREKPGSEFEVSADLVLLALGFSGLKKSKLVEDLQVKRDSRGIIAANADGLTNVPGVFVAGDMARGASLVVRSIADGRHAALGIMRFLAEKIPEP
ncbi:MAG: glutamate synthase subunit beta [Lentisphaerae bacterium]|nr:glutamate synthase subunit beta [Lentisphaerota bacterium]